MDARLTSGTLVVVKFLCQLGTTEDTDIGQTLFWVYSLLE